jgi:hypothetical protein
MKLEFDIPEIMRILMLIKRFDSHLTAYAAVYEKVAQSGRVPELAEYLAVAMRDAQAAAEAKYGAAIQNFSEAQNQEALYRAMKNFLSGFRPTGEPN